MGEIETLRAFCSYLILDLGLTAPKKGNTIKKDLNTEALQWRKD